MSAAAKASGYLMGLSVFRHGQDDDTLCLAEVETCGAHEVADILNEENAMLAERQVRCHVSHRMGIEMATPPGVNLDSRHTGLADAIGVVAGLLVALDDPQRHFRTKRLERLYEQRGFSCSWARHQVQAEDRPAQTSRTGFHRRNAGS